MSNITFKMFLEAVFRKDDKGRMMRVDNLRLSRNERMFIEAAHLIVDEGFVKNFNDGLNNGFLYRGSEYYENYFENDNSFSMCFVDNQRKKDRYSTFSGSQFISNFWHVMDLPSRRRCTMASPSLDMAAQFTPTEPSIIIPRDNTECHSVPSDWNESFEDEIRSVFPGTNVSLGRLSMVFSQFRHRLSQDDNLNYDNDYKDFTKHLNPISNDINNSLQDFKDFFKSLERLFLAKHPNSDLYLLSITPGNGVHNYNMDPDFRKIIYHMIKYTREGSDLFTLFEEIFDKIREKIKSSRTPSNLINNSDNNSEIWWTGCSLVFRGSYSRRKINDLRALKDYVDRVERGDILDDGEPD